MKDKTDIYIKGLVCTGTLIIGKIREDGDIDKPFAVHLTTGVERDRSGNAVPAGVLALVPFLSVDMKVLKRSAIIAETNEIEEDLIKAYQQSTSDVVQPTLRDMSKINQGKNGFVDFNKVSKKNLN